MDATPLTPVFNMPYSNSPSIYQSFNDITMSNSNLPNFFLSNVPVTQHQLHQQMPVYQSQGSANEDLQNGSNNFLSGYTGLTGEEEQALNRAGELNNIEISEESQNAKITQAVDEEEKDGEDEQVESLKEVKLQNVIATVNLQCKLDLQKIQKKARNAEYNPKRFAALIMRIKDPKTTALIFSSGKLVITGARNEQQSKLAARKFARIIKKIGFAARFTEFKIQNMVASSDVGFKISLEDLGSSDHSRFCNYEPELFPGLIYKMASPKATLLIFVSGKIVITGAKSKKIIDETVNTIVPVLSQFKRE